MYYNLFGVSTPKEKKTFYKQEKVRLSAFWRRKEQMAKLEGGQKGKGTEVRPCGGGGKEGEGEDEAGMSAITEGL